MKKIKLLLGVTTILVVIFIGSLNSFALSKTATSQTSLTWTFPKGIATSTNKLQLSVNYDRYQSNSNYYIRINDHSFVLSTEFSSKSTLDQIKPIMGAYTAHYIEKVYNSTFKTVRMDNPESYFFPTDTAYCAGKSNYVGYTRCVSNYYGAFKIYCPSIIHSSISGTTPSGTSPAVTLEFS